MLGEQYQVDYIINLQDNASAGIVKFSQAATKLANATKKFDAFQKRFNEMTATFNKQLELKISTSQASRKLNRVIKQLEKIHNLSTGINVGVAGGAGGAATNRRVSTTQVAAPAPRPTRVSQPQGPRPLVAPRGRQPLVPRNLEYQVLGPTRLGNVAMLDMFKGMGLMYGISAIGSGVRDIISQSTEYENIMQTAKNILKTNYKGGNFNASFIDMERIVREVGVETKFTAPEVADAVKFLAMAGLDINAINKSIRPIADIALIGDTDLGQTADVMTNIMTAYGIKPDDMRKTADVMTRTFTMSNTTLLELAESFKMAGSMLHLANVPFETAAAAFGVLGDAGIKATMAGTTMRTIMNNLRNPTKNQQKYWDMLGIRRYDEYGNIREINDIFADLNKLNGNDARSAEAKRRYDELQKQFAPKFEGLQEGSVEYNKVLSEYDKESEAIRKQFGGVDVFRLFRLTAASGAGVLMNSVEKWNKIIEENFLSAGLSNKLAEQKKNTIAGMWAQLKSAFQEGGLKVFEENDGKIRGYLQKGISWLKSDDFTKMLRSVFDLVADLGKMLVWFTEKVVAFYDKFSPLIKSFLKFQLYLKGIQVILGSFRQVGNAALYSLMPLLNLMGGRRMPAFTSGNVATNVASGVGTGALGGMLYYGIPQKWMGKGYSTLLETGSPVAAVRANPKYNMMNHAQNVAMLRRYQASQKRLTAMNNYSGIGMMGGTALGAIIGKNFNDENGMMWGSLIGGGLGSLAPLLAGSGPWGWVIGGAVVAITGITSAIVKYNREIKKARGETDSYLAALRTLNIGKLDISSSDDIFNANIRITTSLLHTENEKLELQAQLWRRIKEEREGTQEHYDQATSKDVIQKFLNFRDKYYGNMFTYAKNSAFDETKRSVTEELNNKGIFSSVSYDRNGENGSIYWYTMTDSHGNSVSYPGRVYKEGSTNPYFATGEHVNSIAALSLAFDPENPLLEEARADILDRMSGLKSLQEYNDAISQFWGKFGFSIDPSKDISQLKDADFKAMLSDNSLLQYPEYGVPIMKQLESIVKAYEAQRNLLQLVNGFDFNSDNLSVPIKETQASISAFTGNPVFNVSEFGQFGTADWITKMRAYANGTYKGTDQFGKVTDIPNFKGGLAGDEFNKFIQESYKNFIDFFKKLPEEIQPFYYPYLNKSYWESLGGKVNLGEFEGMYQPKDQEEAKSLYPGYTFGQFGGYAAWYDENGKLTVPGYWTMPTQQQSVATPTSETALTNVTDSLQAYTPRIIPMYPEIQTVDVTTDMANATAQVVDMMAGMNRTTTEEEQWRAPYVMQPYVDENALGNSLYASLQPWLTKTNPLSPVTNEEVDRATAEPLYAAFAPSYIPFMPPLSQPAVSNEDFRPSERQPVAMVARPVVININAERLVDFGTLNIDNASDDAEIAQKVRNALEGILAEVAESTGGNYHFGVAS